jgi:hypothetical protein
MSSLTLNSCIIKSLQLGQMHPELPNSLLTTARNKARHRTENRYWDYKQEIHLGDNFQIAELAKDILAFHNTEGGAIIVGITNEYSAIGVPHSAILDTKHLQDKIRRFVGESVRVFQDAIEVSPGKFLWLIFIPKYAEAPQSMHADGPHRLGRPVFTKGQFFYRDGDEVRLCKSEGDIERVFRGFSTEHLAAYNYEVDEPYFRLLNPNCEQFVGRRQKIDEVKTKLSLRHPIVALDGLGGVGKTALAIKAVRELYDEGNRYFFIVSVSAKSKIWLGHVQPKRAAFAGLHGLLAEIAMVFPDIQPTDDTSVLKDAIISLMRDCNGLLLIDNLEEIEDPGVFRFLSQEVPDPVKVLVTSRVAKDIGALTISVPAMDATDAEDLFGLELDRLGYASKHDDDQYRGQILHSAGGVPLAIKWAAQIASERRSLRDASSILRGTGSSKQELLSFCFATMFDSLSETAKSAAALIPYLDVEWRPESISIALKMPVLEVRAAIHELSDKGIIYRQRDDRPDDYAVLPLTRDFLFNKWNSTECDTLRRSVEDRFEQNFSSDEGFLYDWPHERRVAFLLRRSRQRIEEGKCAEALPLIKLAQSWASSGDDPQSEAHLRFLEGKCLYTNGSRAAGIAHMRQALNSDYSASLTGSDLLFFADVLFMHGSSSAEKEASDAAMRGVETGGSLDAGLLQRLIACNIKRGDSKLIARLVSQLQDGALLRSAFDQIQTFLQDSRIAYAHEREWASGLERLLRLSTPEQITGGRYYEKFGNIVARGKSRGAGGSNS